MPIKYIPYFPNTIQGQAILNNFTRTQRALKYRDNDKPAQRILRGMPLYEMETLERVGANPNGNLIIRGECLSACAYLKAQGIQIDLTYIDPPFASGADYAKKIYLRRNPKVAEAIAQAEEEMDDAELQAFEEKMYGDIWNKEAYLNWMYENLTAIKSVMSETGSIYVHLDWHIGHYVKILTDEVFGEDNFRNEVIWKRSSIATNVNTQWRNSHDVLLFYSKSEESIFNVQYGEYSESSKEHFSYQDERGVYALVPLLGSGQTINGESGAIWRDIDPGKVGKGGMHWLKKPSVLEQLEKEGRIYWPEKEGGLPRLKYYLEESKGRYISDVWDDVTVINSMANEALGYPTQKPEELLRRIIESGSNKDMIVADFFGGSGVTAKVARDLGRKFIHVDVGINSIQTARDRLVAAGASFDVLEVQDGVALFRNPAQTMDKLRELIPGMGSFVIARPEGAKQSPPSNTEIASSQRPLLAMTNGGGFWAGAIHDSKLGMIPVYLPNLLDHTQKVLDIPAMNRILNEAMPELPDGVRRVVVYYVDVDALPALEKFIADANPTEIVVELRDLKQVLHEIVVNDVVEYQQDPLGLENPKGLYTIEITKFISDRLMQKIDAYNQKKSLNGGRKRQAKLEEADADAENGNDNGEETENSHADTEVETSPARPFKPIQISADGLELIELVSLDCANAEGAWHSDSETKIDKNSFVILNGKKTKNFWDGKIGADKKPLRMKVRNIAGDETVLSL